MVSYNTIPTFLYWEVLKKDLRVPRELVEDKLNDTVYDIPNLKKVREEINKKSNKAEFVTKDMLCNSLNALNILPQKANLSYLHLKQRVLFLFRLSLVYRVDKLLYLSLQLRRGGGRLGMPTG